MATSFKDADVLRTSPTFQGRVRAAMIYNSISISKELWSVNQYHRERVRLASAILNDPDTYSGRFASMVSADQNVADDATQAGTVELTDTNVEAQQSLVTDSHINSAIASNFNSLLGVV